VISGIEVYGRDNIRQVVSFLDDHYHARPVRIDLERIFHKQMDHYGYDFAEVKGQSRVKRVMETKSAGRHNLLMVGPPGAGRTMPASRLPTILI
jgi:magnesium chelatase family protein